MLYSEFVENTGCKDNEKNYQVYKHLEILYMNCDDISKEEIYEYGRKLVDNSLTPEQVAENAELDKEINKIKIKLGYAEADLARYNSNLRYYTAMGWGDEDESIKFWKKEIRLARKDIRQYKELIKDLKNCKYKE